MLYCLTFENLRSISPVTCPVSSSSLMHSTVIAIYLLWIVSLALTYSSKQMSESTTPEWFLRKYMLIDKPKSFSSESADSIKRPKLKDSNIMRSGLSMGKVRSSWVSILCSSETPFTPSCASCCPACSGWSIWLLQCILTIVTIRSSMPFRTMSENKFSFSSLRLVKNCTNINWRETENPYFSVSSMAC